MEELYQLRSLALGGVLTPRLRPGPRQHRLQHFSLDKPYENCRHAINARSFAPAPVWVWATSITWVCLPDVVLGFWWRPETRVFLLLFWKIVTYRTRGVGVLRVHIMAQNVGNDDTPDIYKLCGFWMGMLFVIGKKHFFAFYRDLQNPIFPNYMTNWPLHGAYDGSFFRFWLPKGTAIIW